jgi:Prophage maintenance system killer protein
MSRIKSVTLLEFQFLIEYAQQYHASVNEPIPEIQVSQYNCINSCLNTPFQTFGNRYLYSGFYPKAAILFYLINKNHCLINGNKRMACLTLGLFCFINKYKLRFAPMDFYELAKSVTNSEPQLKDAVMNDLLVVFKKYITK